MFASSSEINSDGLIRRLTGFERVHLLPGESKVVNFSITVNTLKRTNSIGDIVSTPGDYVVSFTTGGTNGDMNHVNVIAKQKVRIESKPSSETSETESVILERFPKY